MDELDHAAKDNKTTGFKAAAIITDYSQSTHILLAREIKQFSK